MTSSVKRGTNIANCVDTTIYEVGLQCHSGEFLRLARFDIRGQAGKYTGEMKSQSYEPGENRDRERFPITAC